MEGWTDPRMPTVQGMLRRGLQLEALMEFILRWGLGEVALSGRVEGWAGGRRVGWQFSGCLAVHLPAPTPAPSCCVLPRLEH